MSSLPLILKVPTKHTQKIFTYMRFLKEKKSSERLMKQHGEFIIHR